MLVIGEQNVSTRSHSHVRSAQFISHSLLPRFLASNYFKKVFGMIIIIEWKDEGELVPSVKLNFFRARDMTLLPIVIIF